MVVYRDYDPVRRRVARFYAAYNPVKLEEVGFVDEVVKMYASEGEEVFSRLVSEYGPEPRLESGSDEKIESGVASDATVKDEMSVSPDGMPLLGSTFAEPAGALKKAVAGLESCEQESSSLSAGTSSMDIRSRLERFYATHDPVKVNEAGFIEKMVEMYASEGEELFARLVAQYRSEPLLPSGVGGNGEKTDGLESTEEGPGSSAAIAKDGMFDESAVGVDGRINGRRDGDAGFVKGLHVEVDERSKLLQRLESFYGLYNPGKLKEVGFVDKVLEAYAGKEEKLFARLVAQYGPEPAMEAGAGEEGSMPRRHETGATESDDVESASVFESSVSLRT